MTQRPTAKLTAGTGEAVFDLGGGSLFSFRLNGGLNPLVWLDAADNNATFRPMAHFLCLDRWGQPSPGEQKAGVPFHGEAARVEWKIVNATSNELIMVASLPLAGLDVWRRARLVGRDCVLIIQETVTNRNNMIKIYNMVQHPTIGAPFLDEHTTIDSNANRGFMQSSQMPFPEQPSVYWPEALHNGETVNMRFLTHNENPTLVSYVVNGQTGWATASSPTNNLMLGYIWRTSDYPWFNVWRHLGPDNKPLARGLEFGTTGLHQPLNVLLEKSKIFKRNIFTCLDAGESKTRVYIAFLAKIPEGWDGVRKIQGHHGSIKITGRTGKAISVQCDERYWNEFPVVL